LIANLTRSLTSLSIAKDTAFLTRRVQADGVRVALHEWAGAGNPVNALRSKLGLECKST